MGLGHREGNGTWKLILSEPHGEEDGPHGRARGECSNGRPGSQDTGRSGIRQPYIGGRRPPSVARRSGCALCVSGDWPRTSGNGEGMNIWRRWRAPAVFICESNGYAEGTACRRCSTKLSPSRAAAVPGVCMTGNDIFAVLGPFEEAGPRPQGKSPTLIEAVTYRWLRPLLSARCRTLRRLSVQRGSGRLEGESVPSSWAGGREADWR